MNTKIQLLYKKHIEWHENQFWTTVHSRMVNVKQINEFGKIDVDVGVQN